MAQGPAGQAAIIRRPHALSEGSGGLEGDHPADWRDRQGHTGLADRVKANQIPLLCDTDDGQI